MQLRWTHEVYQRWQDARMPFLFKQSSDIYTEGAIDGLERYIASAEVQRYDESPRIRQHPVTNPPLLPFTEHGKRYDDAQWSNPVVEAEHVYAFYNGRHEREFVVIVPPEIKPIRIAWPGETPKEVTE